MKNDVYVDVELFCDRIMLWYLDWENDFYFL